MKCIFGCDNNPQAKLRRQCIVKKNLLGVLFGSSFFKIEAGRYVAGNAVRYSIMINDFFISELYLNSTMLMWTSFGSKKRAIEPMKEAIYRNKLWVNSIILYRAAMISKIVRHCWTICEVTCKLLSTQIRTRRLTTWQRIFAALLPKLWPKLPQKSDLEFIQASRRGHLHEIIFKP